MPGGTRQNIGFIGFFRHIGGYDPDICSGLPAILTARLFWIAPERHPERQKGGPGFYRSLQGFYRLRTPPGDDTRLAN